jgi:hypothetical protein
MGKLVRRPSQSASIGIGIYGGCIWRESHAIYVSGPRLVAYPWATCGAEDSQPIPRNLSLR